ncbi:MAG: hypothetical protein A2W99_16595 [Bacteroidetes bacterium GWF2_33_16]|nr:MAG: hypothetical protein A2X00_14200 [Bacteroidetes bacterium GWE2_32_14]OFY03369.1 MAG: hypothetical protein A2W99_16595 [Bacteroidetes bacterium GWF2_33_16]
MKKHIVTLCLAVLIAMNLFSQNGDEKSFFKIDTGYINVDRGKLFYEIVGEGENIVLLHDGMVSHEIWDEQFALLARNYRVTRYDRRTYGKSSDPQANYSHIEDLNQVFNQLKIDSAIIFGMSAGGGLAIDFTLKYPEKVNGLVLVGAVVGGYGYTSHMFTRGGRIDQSFFADEQKLLNYFIEEDPYEIYPENIRAKEKVKKIFGSNPKLNRGNGFVAIRADRPAVKFLSEIKVPTLVLVGEFDIPDVHAHSGVIESGIPNAKREIILKSGHLIPLEQPDAFNKLVIRFLERLEFNSILNSQGVDAAVNHFNTKRTKEPEIVLFEEVEMNLLGYKYLQEEKIKEAVKLFELNTIAFPTSWNVFDSYGEALLKDGQKELAIKNYKKSLELNPSNTNAIEVLNNINGATQQSNSNNLLNRPESIIYDKTHNRYLLSNYETGSIVQIDSTGKQSVLVENKNAIQGLEIVGNVVYVGARNSVRGFNLETGDMAMNIVVEGVSNLNDVTADDAGNIYAGDVFGTKIIKINIKNNSYSILVDGNGIDQPNGLFFDKPNNRILVCSFRKNFPIQAISLDNLIVTTLATTNLNNADGIVLDKYGRCYVTSWETKSIYRFDKEFKNPPIVFYKNNSCAPADISYDNVHDAIAIPLMLFNSYEIVPVDPPNE